MYRLDHITIKHVMLQCIAKAFHPKVHLTGWDCCFSHLKSKIVSILVNIFSYILNVMYSSGMYNVGRGIVHV